MTNELNPDEVIEEGRGMQIEDKRILVLGQIALFNAEIEMMKAENSHREMQGLSQAYGEEQFAALIKNFEGSIGHNAVIDYLRD